MACFPRWFRRQKTSFTLAEDENNPETLLRNNENNVRIGRYVRHEDISFALTNREASSVSQTQCKHNSSSSSSSEGEEEEKAPKSIRNNKNNNNNNNNKNNKQTINNDNSFINQKFIPQKHNQKQERRHNNNNNSNNHNSANIESHNIWSKFKPVRERRPTALLKDQTHFKVNHRDFAGDDEGEDQSDVDDYKDVDDNEHEAKSCSNNGNVALVSAKNTKIKILHPEYVDDNHILPHNSNVKFFIGPQESDVDSLDTDSRNSTANANGPTVTSAPQSRQPTTIVNTPKSIIRTNSYLNLAKGTTIMPSTSPSHSPTLCSFPHSVNSTASSIGGSSYSRNVVNNLPKSSKTSRYSSSLESKTTKCRSRQNALTEVVNIPPPPPLPPQLLTSASSSTSLASQKLSRGPARDLKIKSNAQDAQNENKDQTPSPNDSDGSSSPKSHRTEGGLIFIRPTPPEKENAKIEYIQKDQKARNLIRAAIEKNDFLNNYMDKERKEMVIDAMERASYHQDSFIIHENEEGDEIFVSEEGYFEVIKAGEVIGTLGPGTVFGELAILYNAKRFASIKAKTSAHVWKIGREKFRNIMIISGSREREENLNFLRSAPFLQELAESVLDRVVDLLQRKFYETNTCIVREGEVGNEFFIIRGGTVTIKKRNEYDVERVVDRRKRGDYFGEQALLNADRRQASVYADAPGTECLKLDREAFISYLGTIPQLREKPIERTMVGQPSYRKSDFDNEYANIELADLKQIATLGAGAFGRVDLVSFQAKTYALKIIKKIDVVKQDQVEHVYSEKHVMMKCRSSPFIIELYKTFRNDKYVFFLMEACLGGDVWTVMSQRRFFDEKTARFIAACVVEAFGYLHSQNIIYRDLKPENLMLTTDGYCKLVDFGFAKYVPPHQKTNTFAGTPEYVAPEIILDRGHDCSVDYWALGILIFELLVGKTPFRGQNQIKIYQQILSGIDVIQMPSKIPKSAQNLIKNLCKQLPAERLGYQRKGILDIKKHSWFDSLDWNKLKTKQLTSPIKRPITSNTDIQYFVSCDTENDYDYEPPDENSGWDADF